MPRSARCAARSARWRDYWRRCSIRLRRSRRRPLARSAPVQFNEADVELYGEDLLEAASRAAEAKLEARYGKTIQNLQQHVQQLSGRQEEDRVFRELDSDPELAGRWRNLNTNPQFIEWLQAVDEMAGVSRNTMLQHAYANGDAMRTGRFFKKFMAEHTAPPPTAMAPQTTQPTRYQPMAVTDTGTGQRVGFDWRIWRLLAGQQAPAQGTALLHQDSGRDLTSRRSTEPARWGNSRAARRKPSSSKLIS